MVQVVDMPVNLEQLVAQALKQVLAQQAAVGLKPTVDRKVAMLSKKDKQLAKLFAKRGFKDVVLMDRNDKSKDFNVRSYNGWLAVGHQVMKGQTSVRGLFHITQTEKATTKPIAASVATDLVADQFSQIGA